RALADASWDALPRGERGGQQVHHLPPAIILDADETVIDNSAYQARLVERNESFDPVTWEAFVNERRSRAIPGAVEFLRMAAQRGVTVFYVTNRSAAEKAATYDNLRALGFPMSDPEDTVLTIDELQGRSEEHTSELQSRENVVCRLLLEKKTANRGVEAEPKGKSKTANPIGRA